MKRIHVVEAKKKHVLTEAQKENLKLGEPLRERTERRKPKPN